MGKRAISPGMCCRGLLPVHPHLAWGGASGKIGEMWVKGYKFSIRRSISSGDLMYSIVYIGNSTVIYLSKLLRD